jgi:hypothetical protein
VQEKQHQQTHKKKKKKGKDEKMVYTKAKKSVAGTQMSETEQKKAPLVSLIYFLLFSSAEKNGVPGFGER